MTLTCNARKQVGSIFFTSNFDSPETSGAVATIEAPDDRYAVHDWNAAEAIPAMTPRQIDTAWRKIEQRDRRRRRKYQEAAAVEPAPAAELRPGWAQRKRGDRAGKAAAKSNARCPAGV